jgi:hypothetical protein
MMTKYQINITSKDLSIQQSVNRILADKIALLLINERIRKMPSTKKRNDTQENANIGHELTKMNTETPDLNFLDFLDIRGTINSGEHVACLGLFLNEKGQSSFTKNEYRMYFKMIKGKPPTNVPRDFDAALAKNWISEEAHEQFKITLHGKEMCNGKII